VTTSDGSDPTPAEMPPEGAPPGRARPRGGVSRLLRRYEAADARDNSFERRALPMLLWKLVGGGAAAILAALGLLPTLERPAAPAVRHTVDVQAEAAVERLVRGEFEATVGVVSEGTTTLPYLIAALRARSEAPTRRRLSEALRLVTETHGGALRRPDLDALDELARADPDPTVRADCVAARARVSLFWR
jgi:hypothetical protein